MFACNHQKWAALVLWCGLAAYCPAATAQDVGDLLNEIADDSDAPQQSPVDLLERESVVNELQLNNDQREKSKTIIADYRRQADEVQKSYDDQLKAITSLGERLRKTAEFRAAAREKTDELKAQAEQSLLELLSNEQKTALQKRLPEPASPAPSAGTTGGSAAGGGTRPSFGRRGGSGSSGDSRPSSTSSFSSRSSSGPAARTANTVMSFAAVDDPIALIPSGDAVPAANPNETTSPKPPAADTPPQKLSFNFFEAPWTDVLRLFVKSARLSLNMRDVPPGSFTYYDTQQYTPAQALDIMNQMLLLDGFILVRHNRFLSVFDTKNGIPPNLVDTVTIDELEERGETELVRVSFPLGDRAASKTAEEVRSLLGPQGKSVPLESANSIVVTDIKANLVRVRDLLRDDRKVEKEELIVKPFPLTKIDANEAADIIRSLLGVQTGVPNVSAVAQPNNSSRGGRGGGRGGRGGRGGGGGGGFDPRQFLQQMRGGGDDDDNDSTPTPAAPSQPVATSQSKVAVDVRTNTVLVTATAANMKLVEEMVKALDVEPAEFDGLDRTRNAREPYLEVYQLKTADASEVAKTLNALHPGTVVNEERNTRRVHIMANAKKHQEIAAHVRQLDGGGGGDLLAVLPLDGLNGYDVSTTVTALYQNDPDNAPSVQFDPSGRSLIIRGDVNQIQLVRSMIDQLAELGPYESQGRAIQIVGSGNASSSFLQQTFGSLYPNQVTFTAAAPVAAPNESTQTNGRGSRGRGGSGDSSSDEERERRRAEWRERFGGFFNRGGDSSDSGANDRSRGGRRGGGRATRRGR